MDHGRSVLEKAGIVLASAMLDLLASKAFHIIVYIGFTKGLSDGFTRVTKGLEM